MKVFYNLVKEDGLLADPEYRPEYLVFYSDAPMRHFYFKTYREFEKHYLELVKRKDEENKYPHWFEVIKGTRPQKPHFDIDIVDDTDPSLVLQELFISVERVVRKMGHDFSEEDFYVYTSLDDEKENNKHAASYHVILPRFHHSDNHEARAFYEEVVLYMIYRRFIDVAVYKSHQNFRLLWSSKGSSRRQKIPLGSDDLHSSMVSQLEKGSIHLKIQMPISQEIMPDMDEREIVYAIQMIPQDHSLRGVSGPFIILNRHASGMCRLCSRAHDGENGFMFIKDGLIYYNCRRTDVGGLVLGVAPVEEVSSIEKVPVLKKKPRVSPMDRLRRMASTEVDDSMWNIYRKT